MMKFVVKQSCLMTTFLPPKTVVTQWPSFVSQNERVHVQMKWNTL